MLHNERYYGRNSHIEKQNKHKTPQKPRWKYNEVFEISSRNMEEIDKIHMIVEQSASAVRVVFIVAFFK